MIESGKAYFIINKAINSYLDLSSGDSTSVLAFPYNGGYRNQKWIAFQQDYYWIFQSMQDGTKYLSMRDFHGPVGKKAMGSQIPASWKLEKATWDNYRDYYYIVLSHSLANGQSKLALEPANVGTMHASTPVTVYPQHYGDGQIWEFVPA